MDRGKNSRIVLSHSSGHTRKPSANETHRCRGCSAKLHPVQGQCAGPLNHGNKDNVVASPGRYSCGVGRGQCCRARGRADIPDGLLILVVMCNTNNTGVIGSLHSCAPINAAAIAATLSGFAGFAASNNWRGRFRQIQGL
jgi:hypothetical protein